MEKEWGSRNGETAPAQRAPIPKSADPEGRRSQTTPIPNDADPEERRSRTASKDASNQGADRNGERRHASRAISAPPPALRAVDAVRDPRPLGSAPLGIGALREWRLLAVAPFVVHGFRARIMYCVPSGIEPSSGSSWWHQVSARGKWKVDVVCTISNPTPRRRRRAAGGVSPGGSSRR